MKAKHLLLCLVTLIFSPLMRATDLTDVTSKYLVNPSFEADDITSLSAVTSTSDGLRGYTLANPQGWAVSGTSVTQLLVTADCFTDNNFGKVTSIADGTYAYYLRMGWSTGTTMLTQTVDLPAGHYQLAVDQRSAYANNATSTLKMSAASESNSTTFSAGSTSCFTSMTWSTCTLDFTLTSDTQVNLSISINWQSGGSCIMLDNVRLLLYPEGYTEPEEPTETDVNSPTEGVITNTFVPESEMMSDLLQMLANFSTYMVNDFQQCSATNSLGESCGYFKGEDNAANNEKGVRPNADLSMICAFLVKYGKPAGVTLPAGVTWDKLQEMANKSLIFAYSTHKANKLKVCSGGNYWGSTSTSDAVWESSLWAMSVAYSAYFQWDNLSDAQKSYIYALLKAECNYELGRSIPTGYSGDTKAEENGWEADILAATLGLFPNDDLAPQWFARLREFAINSYSHYTDASKGEIIDPQYDSKTIADLYKGNNLYGDYTLQNHNLFHTSYQNVVMQELGEAALALQMFQKGIYGTEKWKTNALMHNNQEVMDSVMNWLALADGELAMPNGNDWSLFLYDQITSYTTQACYQQDPNALTLENLAYKQIKARQATTTDGSWLLRADVGARRMGVESHRVMMTYLMHLMNSTANVTPTDWETFRAERSEAKLLPYQNVVRAYTKERFTTFSWSTGLKSYTGYFAANCPDKNKIVVPYRANNTGNLLGWYEVSGKSTDASPVVSGIYNLKGDGYTMNGEILTNGSTLDNRFAIYSTPGNAIIYLDYVKGLASGTITAEKGGLLAISTDELTKLTRTLYYSKSGEITHKQLDGSTFSTFTSDWVTIDNELGIVGQNGKSIAFGDRGANNSIYTSKLYPMYTAENRDFSEGSVVDHRHLIYYSNIDAETTARMNSELQVLTDKVPDGWNGVIAADPDSTRYLLLSNFQGTSNRTSLTGITCPLGAPVFSDSTIITADGTSAATFTIQQNHSVSNVLRVFLKGIAGIAIQDPEDTGAVYLTPSTNGTANVTIITDSQVYTGNINTSNNTTIRICLKNGQIFSEEASFPSTEVPNADKTSTMVNPNFDEGAIGWTGSPTVNYSAAEKFNTDFDVYQDLTGLAPGIYEVSCQGFYRDGSYDNAANLHSSGKEALNAVLYAKSNLETVDTTLTSIFTEAGMVGTVGVSQSKYGYIPNTMEQASFYFKAGLYNNKIKIKVDRDGKLTIGVKKTTTVTNDWTIFDNFTLTYIAPVEAPEDGISQMKYIPFAKGDMYTLSGLRVANKEQKHGIYICNGKKILK